jgi:hypothetical protein
MWHCIPAFGVGAIIPRARGLSSSPTTGMDGREALPESAARCNALGYEVGPQQYQRARFSRAVELLPAGRGARKLMEPLRTLVRLPKQQFEKFGRTKYHAWNLLAKQNL